MFLIVSATGAAGFLFSFLLLKAGLSVMWLRYPLAVGFAYLVFLLLLRLWLAYANAGESPVTFGDALDAAGDLTEMGVTARWDSTGRAGDGLDALELEEGCFLVVVIAGLCSGLLVCGYVIWTAPALLAELLVDGIVMSRVYKGMRKTDQPYWVYSALRRTWLPAVLIAVFLAIAGFAMQQIAPDAASIDSVVEYVAGQLP